MPVPAWVAKINRKVFNPMEIKRGVRPVLIHVGRSSGKEYQTPLDALPVEDGYVFIPMYGVDKSDWVKNVLAAGHARLRVQGEETRLTSPRLISKDEAWELIEAGTKAPPERLNITDYLRMDLIS